MERRGALCWLWLVSTITCINILQLQCTWAKSSEPVQLSDRDHQSEDAFLHIDHVQTPAGVNNPEARAMYPGRYKSGKRPKQQHLVQGETADGATRRSALRPLVNGRGGRGVIPHVRYIPDVTYIPDHNCAGVDMSAVATGNTCGSPLGAPCFDYSRCTPVSEGGTGSSIYVYDDECSLKDSSLLTMSIEMENARMLSPFFRKAANELGVLAESYATACMFIHVNNVNVLHNQTPCAVNTPLWSNGTNHLMVDFSDNSRDTRPSVGNSYAMEAASNTRTCLYRSGYDISLPLSPKHVFKEFFAIPAADRKFFLTVKGSIYLSGHGMEARMSLVPLHDERNGIISSMHCFEKHQEHLLPENAAPCHNLKAKYDDYDYGELMNTTFGLVPGGRSPGTYRLAEVMSAGAIPVFVGRDMVRPFTEQIDWPSFSFLFTPDEVNTLMVKTLRAVTPDRLAEMQRKVRKAYLEVFGFKPVHKGTSATRAYSQIARKVIITLQQRVAHHR